MVSGKGGLVGCTLMAAVVKCRGEGPRAEDGPGRRQGAFGQGVTGLHRGEMQNWGRGHQEGPARAKACLACSSPGDVGCREQRRFRLSGVCAPGQGQHRSPESWGGDGGAAVVCVV